MAPTGTYSSGSQLASTNIAITRLAKLANANPTRFDTTIATTRAICASNHRLRWEERNFGAAQERP